MMTFANMPALLPRYRPYIMSKDFLLSLAASLVLLLASLVVNFYGALYAAERASNSLTDMILSNTRVYDVDFLFIYGPILFWIGVAALLVFNPQCIPFTLKSIALFVLIRSLFITLTHIGPFPETVIIDSNFIRHFTFGGDLFFSGHTGLPFLLALLFWHRRNLRLIFIFTAILFGAVVLMGHLHYTIDVVSAFFITYGIHRMAELLFKDDHHIFLRGIEEA